MKATSKGSSRRWTVNEWIPVHRSNSRPVGTPDTMKRPVGWAKGLIKLNLHASRDGAQPTKSFVQRFVVDRARRERRENKIQQDHLGSQDLETATAVNHVNPVKKGLFLSPPLSMTCSLCGEWLLVVRGSQPVINRHREGGGTGFSVAVVNYLRA